MRQDAEADLREPGAAGALDALDRAHVDVLDHLGEELAEGAGGVERDGEHAGERAEAEGDDEDQGEDDVGDGAVEFAEFGWRGSGWCGRG